MGGSVTYDVYTYRMGKFWLCDSFESEEMNKTPELLAQINDPTLRHRGRWRVVKRQGKKARAFLPA